jgi:hypothetical protein
MAYVFILEKGKYYITTSNKDLLYIIAHMNNTEWTTTYRPIDYYTTDDSLIQYYTLRYGEDNVMYHSFE